MQRAGLALADCAQTIAPQARCIWVACGPGNNDGDGLVAATELLARGQPCVVSLLGLPAQLPPDAHQAYQRALQAGVHFGDAPPEGCELMIDAWRKRFAKTPWHPARPCNRYISNS